jgi:hypothetical protein
VSNREPSVEFMSLGERLEEERVSWLKVAEERDKRRKTKIIKLNNVIGARGIMEGIVIKQPYFVNNS